MDKDYRPVYQTIFLKDESDTSVEYVAAVDNITVAKVQDGFEIGISLRVTEIKK